MDHVIQSNGNDNILKNLFLYPIPFVMRYSCLYSLWFTFSLVDQDTLTVKYKDAFSLMTDLQNMGENNALSVKKQHLSRDTLLATAAIYKEMYGDEQGDIPATFQVIYLIGWKPHPNQPKPKRRGSGTHKFTGEAIKKEETGKKEETDKKEGDKWIIKCVCIHKSQEWEM